MSPGAASHHTDRKLMRWALTIVFGKKRAVQSSVTLWNPPDLSVPYRWNLVEDSTVHGTAALPMRQEVIVLRQEPDGFHWRVDEKASFLVGCRLMWRTCINLTGPCTCRRGTHSRTRFPVGGSINYFELSRALAYKTTTLQASQKGTW
ncbi:hypothetical protein CCR75_004597 [Bremia lactucae]|uniref:Uncharacterized protein n=1 Tax=Bremia lactucae TaxID=4779 RepID=A0A976FKZ7_BRELC|nr:hypothetical protein CCR75_004597 [Bremia lactucae]